MAFYKAVCVLLAFCVFSISASERWFNEEGYDEDERELAMELRMLREQRNAFDCNKEGESCKGVVRCCGSLQCYWKDGYSILKAGECVQCVQNGQLCQRDKQCCSQANICHKANRFYVDGRCGSPRPAGQECHDDDQCLSKNCKISYWNNVKGQGGSCA